MQHHVNFEKPLTHCLKSVVPVFCRLTPKGQIVFSSAKLLKEAFKKKRKNIV